MFKHIFFHKEIGPQVHNYLAVNIDECLSRLYPSWRRKRLNEYDFSFKYSSNNVTCIYLSVLHENISNILYM